MNQPRRVRTLSVVLMVSIACSALGLVVAISVVPADRAVAVGTTRYVAPGGSDTANTCTLAGSPCATLGHALAVAVAYDTIQLEPGVYMVRDDPSGTTNTVGLYQTTIQSDPVGGTAANTVIDATGEANGLLVHANRATVKNLTIRNAERQGIFATPIDDGLHHSVQELTLSGNTVINNDRCAQHPSAPACARMGTDYGAGIQLRSNIRAIVTNNTITGNVGGLLVTDELGPSYSLEISRNTVNANTLRSGIMLSSRNPDANAGVSRVDAYLNTVNGNGGAGILLSESVPGAVVFNVSLQLNTASNNGLAGITIHSRTPLSRYDRYSIRFDIGHNTLRNNALHGGAGGAAGDLEAGAVHTVGILVASPSPMAGAQIIGNHVYDAFYGIWLSTLTPRVVIEDNEVFQKAGGTKVFVAAPRASATIGLAATTPGHGYWQASATGGVFPMGYNNFYGNAEARVLGGSVAGIAVSPALVGRGYWIAASDGGVFNFGRAAFYGSAGGLHLSRPVVGIAARPVTGNGYWLVASDGGIFTYGDAPFFGSTGAIHLNQPVVGMAATPTGHGYWLVAADGGIFSYGDAAFYGSTGAIHLNQPIVGIAATPTGHGYWLVASDGGIFAFGDAAFYGSTGAIHLNQPIVGLAATPTGHGYWLAASDGGIFSYGDAHYYGSESAR